MNSQRGGTGCLPALAEAGAMPGMGELPALRKRCDTRALDLMVSVGTGMGWVAVKWFLTDLSGDSDPRKETFLCASCC